QLTVHPTGQVFTVFDRCRQRHKLPTASLSDNRAQCLNVGASIRIANDLQFISDDQGIGWLELSGEDQTKRLLVRGDNQLRVDVAFGSVSSVESYGCNRLGSPLSKSQIKIKVLLVRQRFMRYKIDCTHTGT